MDIRRILLEGGEAFAELESLTLLAAGRVARAAEASALPRAAQLAGGRAAEEDRRRSLAQRGDADLRTSLPFEEAALQGGEDDVLARNLPLAFGDAAPIQHKERGPAAELAAELERLGLRERRHGHQQEQQQLHSGVSLGTRKWKSVPCW